MTFSRYRVFRKLCKASTSPLSGTSIIPNQERLHLATTTTTSIRRIFLGAKERVSVKELSRPRIDVRSTENPPYGILLIPLGAFGLGCWQIQRRDWKLDLIEKLDERTKSDPTELPADLNELEHMEYRPVKVCGVFDHDNELFISPRQELGMQESGDRGGLMSSADGIGALVITPFLLTEGLHEGIRILINRGWVPTKKMNPETRAQGQVKGEVKLVGVARHSEGSSMLGDNDKSSNVWQSRDINGIAEKLKTLPVLLDADVASSVKGGPIGGQTRVNLRNEHLSYIVTWYSLAFLTLAMFWFRYKRPVKARR